MNKFSISKRMKGLKPFTLNFGLQHSVAHDPLRLILTLFYFLFIMKLSLKITSNIFKYYQC
jgi:hypothetical protein